MLAKYVKPGSSAKVRRHGVAAVEFAVCLPLLFTILAGLWEVGRADEREIDVSLGDKCSITSSMALTPRL